MTRFAVHDLVAVDRGEFASHRVRNPRPQDSRRHHIAHIQQSAASRPASAPPCPTPASTTQPAPFRCVSSRPIGGECGAWQWVKFEALNAADNDLHWVRRFGTRQVGLDVCPEWVRPIHAVRRTTPAYRQRW
jgi:hypothetical protein